MARPTPPPRELVYLQLTQLRDDTTFRLRLPGDVSSLARSIAQAGQLFPIEVRPVDGGYQPITGFRRLAALRILHRDRVLCRVHPDLGDEAAALVAAADALDNRSLEKDDLLELRERYRGMGWSTPALEELIGRALEKADEQLEDLQAKLAGLPPPDRTIVDEDALEDVEADGRPHEDEPAARQPANVVAQPPTEPPSEPPGAMPLQRQPLAAGNESKTLTVEELAHDLAKRFSLLSQDLAQLAPEWDSIPDELRAILADQLRYYRALGAWVDSQGEEA